MKVGDWMTREVATCRSDETLGDAAQAFWGADVGWLAVVDSRGNLVGALTDRDACLGAHFGGRAPGAVSVTESMARELETASATDSLAATAERMGRLRLRRLPVVDAEGRLRGVIGFGDLARAAREAKSAKDRETAREALADAWIEVALGAAETPDTVRPAAPAKKAEPSKAAASGSKSSGSAKKSAKMATKKASPAKTAGTGGRKKASGTARRKKG